MGGETAELPGFYADGEYDLAGFSVGVVEKSRRVDGRAIRAGDRLLGLASSGFHSNGYSLVRRVFLDHMQLPLDATPPGLNEPLAAALLRPTRIYVRALRALHDADLLRGAAHITGGGLVENPTRMLPADARLRLRIHLDAWTVPPIFGLLARGGDVAGAEMLRTFNMGIGMVICVAGRPRRRGGDAAAAGRRAGLLDRRGGSRRCARRARGVRGPGVGVNVGVLVSGSGTNLQSLIDRARRGELGPARIAVVGSNVPDCAALARARAAGLPTFVVDHRDYSARAGFDRALLTGLRAKQTDLLVLAGFMRVLGEELLGAFPGRIINIHPALLPAFAGIRAQRQAFEAGVKVTGCTVHFVDQGVDTGPIIAQSAVVVHEEDDEESLRARILAEEHRLLPAVVRAIAERRVVDRGPEGPHPRRRAVG